MFQDVILLTDATKRPSRETKDEFKQMISLPTKCHLFRQAIHAVFFIRDTVKFRQNLSLNYSINLPYGCPLFVPYIFGNFTWFVSL